MSRSLKFSLALSAAVAASALLSACEKQDAQQSKTQPAPVAEVAPQQSKSVVVYFSQTGATKKLAQIFRQSIKRTGRIVTACNDENERT